VNKKLICILRGDQKVGMNITVLPKTWYDILQADHKFGMNISGGSKSWYKNITG
jgi:hypothetical protein